MRPPGSEEQPGLFAAPQRLFPCTPSKLGTYADCQRRYRYVYVDRPAPRRGPPWAHNSLGASVHGALRAWYLLPATRRADSAIPSLLRAAWVAEGYRDDAQAAGAYQQALTWLEAYLADLDPGIEPVGVERVVAAKTATLAFSGRVDRIARAGAGLAIIDYKTGRRPLTVDDARGSQALALYAFAAERVFHRPCRRVELHHLPTRSIAVHEHTDQSLACQVRRAEETAAEARAAESALAGGADPDATFPASVGPQCAWCDFRRTCPEGERVPAREPWAAMDNRGIRDFSPDR
ncbi:MAG: PD-(D/E)XK nuclease family protein [Dactylosporangium sp.]|nr:PD-(D/E)XK nuclease family protein [Dactylosporangium sp.]NNJ61535.1 PD-(D/E)XK nuclease family protein [Dactylosporangium sp.]